MQFSLVISTYSKVSRKKIDGDVEAHLVALACSETPEVHFGCR